MCECLVAVVPSSFDFLKSLLVSRVCDALVALAARLDSRARLLIRSDVYVKYKEYMTTLIIR